MTLINITTAELGNQIVPVTGTIEATYWQGAQPAITFDGPNVIIAKSTALNPGTIEMQPTALVMCVRWIIQTAAGTLTRYTSIPVSDSAIDFIDLPDVDPRAFKPVPATATLMEYVARIKEGPQGIPGDITPAFLQLAADIDADRIAAGSSAAEAGVSATAASTAKAGAETAQTGAQAARAAAEAARDVSMAGQFAGSVVASAGVDLNNLLTPGVYTFSTSAATASTNTPANVLGIMEVLAVNSTRLVQRYTPLITTTYRGYWERVLAGSGWQAWRWIGSQRTDQTAGRAVYVWDDLNNRDQLIYGDSGWRVITADLANGWTGIVRLRRTGSTCELAISGLVEGTAARLLTLPSGFRPSAAIPAMARPLSATEVPVYGTVNTTGDVSLTTGRQYNSGTSLQATWTTTDAWPTALPGTASGSIPNL